MMPPSRIAELASIISSNTSQVDDYVSTHNLPPLSFEPNGHLKQDTLPDTIQSAQHAILEATDELNALMLGPDGILRQQFVRPPHGMNPFGSMSDLLTLSVVRRTAALS